MAEAHESPLHVCLDTNVVLDVLLERKPFVRSAATLIDAIARRRLRGFLVATTLTTIDFILKRQRDRSISRQGINWLFSIFDIAPVNRAALELALKLDWPVYEDAVLHESARIAGSNAIVTRNPHDFNNAELSIYTPDEFLAILNIG